MPIIKDSELKPGDVLLKFTEETGSNKLIEAGQFVASHNASGGHAWTVHAAIYAGDRRVYEASGQEGLRCKEFNKSGVLYFVHRYNKPEVAQLAATVAEGYVAEREKNAAYGQYSKSGALSALVHSSSRGKGAQTAEAGLWGDGPNVPSDSFYCSGFVVRAYAAAGQTCKPAVVPINADFRYVSPKELEGRLKSSADWKEIGQIVT